MSATDYALMRSSGTSGVHTLLILANVPCCVPPELALHEVFHSTGADDQLGKTT